MTFQAKTLAHLREAVRSIETAMHSAVNLKDPAQVQRYVRAAQDRLGRADAAAGVWKLGGDK